MGISEILGTYSSNRRLKLLKKREYEKFIAVQKKAVSKMKDGKLKNVSILNLSTGYQMNAQYDEALNVLKGMDLDSMDRSSKVVYYLSLLSCYIKIGDEEMMDKILSEGEGYMNLFKKVNGSQYNCIIAEYHACRGHWDEGQRLLSETDTSSFGEQDNFSYRYAKGLVHAGLGEIEEARSILEYLSEKQISPSEMWRIDNLSNKIGDA